jgi:hypothetical protein
MSGGFRENKRFREKGRKGGRGGSKTHFLLPPFFPPPFSLLPFLLDSFPFPPPLIMSKNR